MKSEGQIFRRAYGSLDRLAPTAPDFETLGAIKLTAAGPVDSPSRWLMGMATAGVVIVVALIPVLLYGPPNLPFGSGGPPTTTLPMATTLAECLVATTTTTISPTGAPLETSPPTTALDPCATSTSGPFAPDTTTTIEASGSPSSTGAVEGGGYSPERAETYLREFFELLRDGQYEMAYPRYGGSYDALIEMNPTIHPQDRAALLAAACETQLLCELTIAEVISTDLVSENQFVLEVTLEWPDGSPYEVGFNNVWVFRVEMWGGVTRVMDLPIERS